MFLKNAIGRGVQLLGLAFALILTLSGSACYIPGILEPTEATDLPEGAVSGEAQIFYGKFVYYQLANGKLKTLGGSGIDLMVGDEIFFPDSNNDDPDDYNYLHSGREDYLTYHYKDTVRDLIVASGRPETIILHERKTWSKGKAPWLTMFYTDARIAWGDSSGNYPESGSTIAIPTGIIVTGAYDFKGDVDTYSVTFGETTVLSVQARFSQLFGSADIVSGNRHRIQLRLLDGSTVLATSTHALDFWKYLDADLSAVLAPGTYYIEISDIRKPLLESNGSQDSYRMLVEASTDSTIGWIKKGELQPARSCNPVLSGDTINGFTGCPHQLQGGATFEPDDLTTEIKDITPDCDGIPGNGNEGDAGIYEMCGAFSDFGARDGNMQYMEVDDKTTIEDGEYFVGKPTNVPAFVDTEATIIRTPDDSNPDTKDSLSMFVAYNTGIYWLESLDGDSGENWNLATLYGGTILGSGNVVVPADSAAVTPLSRRGSGDPTTPVITSGIYGFCETAPAPGDAWGAPELEQFANLYGTTPTATGTMINSPTAYPNTTAITYGGNAYLDSLALRDELDGATITSGEDGIINTFFAPNYVAYPQTPVTVSGFPPIPYVYPGDSMIDLGMSGPGNPDNPPLYDGNVGAYIYPMEDPKYKLADGSTPEDRHAFLLGDDEWNPDIFRGDTLNPAEYWRRQRCHFFSIGYNFDRCAMAVPEDENGNEPVSILPGKGERLRTVDQLLKEFRGDDVLCHDGATVGICPGPDGRFGWQDIYLAIKGDDYLAVMDDAATPDPTDKTVGLSSGPNGVIDSDNIARNYTLIDYENLTLYIGGDIDCKDEFNRDAICPGNSEYTLDYYNGATASRPSRKLMSIWPMYITSPSYPLPTAILGFLGKKDIYNLFDDEFCAINNEVAICPGQDGVFQGYPLSQRVEVDSDDDLFVLHDRVQDLMEVDCYSLRAEFYREEFSEKEAIRFVFYHDLGIRMDDRVRWTPELGYHITTGRNGINQSCTSSGDRRVIPMWQGLADQPIITPGADGVFQTYPLQDEEFKWADNVRKISSGPDGVSNSYIRGDDKLEMFMGTGKADYPCVRSGDGIADTVPQNYSHDLSTPVWTNDRQIYGVGERTGFDAFQVFGPKAVSYDDKIFLYYSALGWEEYPEQFRSDSGALGDVGECRRPGFDMLWGDRSPDFGLRTGENTMFSLYKYDLLLFEKEFKNLLDNNEGVGIAPRIGLAVSSIKRLREDPTDWDIRKKPVLDLGQQCTGSMSFPISLPIDLPGMMPDTNFYGAFSPEIELSLTPEGEDLFLMFFTGLSQGEKDNDAVQPTATIGMARSFDGIKWEMVRDFKSVMTTAGFDLLGVVGAGGHVAYPTIYNAGEDEYGQDMYGMFFNRFTFTDLWVSKPYTTLNIDFHGSDHIGWALRRGMSYMSSCSMSPDTFSDRADRNRRLLQFAILALPVALAGIFSLSRRRRNKV